MVAAVAGGPCRATQGDAVEIAGKEGIVERVGIFQTVLRAYQNHDIVLPNSEITTAPIINFTARGERRIDLPPADRLPMRDREAQGRIAAGAVGGVVRHEQLGRGQAEVTGKAGQRLILARRAKPGLVAWRVGMGGVSLG